WIVSCAWLGYTERALQIAGQARNVLLKHNELYKACLIDHNTAVIYSQAGQYGKALELYERLLTVYPTLKQQNEVAIKHSLANVEVNKARNLSWLGDLEQAYSLLLSAQEKLIALGQSTSVVSVEMELAALDYIQGYYGSALRRYYHARNRLLHESVDAPPDMLAAIMLEMATCLVKLSRHKEAYQLAREAVEAHQRLGISLTTGYALREYATILVAAGRVEEALERFDEAYALFAQGHFDHHAATTKLQKAELLLSMGEIAEAYEQARTMKEYFDAQNLIPRSLRACLVMAEALIATGQRLESGREKEQQAIIVQQATELCHMVTKRARQQKLQEEVYRSQQLLGNLALLNGNPERAARHYKVAIHSIERILNGLVYDLGPAFLHTTWNVYEDMIALCLRQGRPDLALSYLERARSMALRQYLNKSSRGAGAGASPGVRPRADDPSGMPPSPLMDEEQTNGSEIQREGSDASSLQTNNALLLRMQYQMRLWQEKYHDYSALLAKIDAEAVAGLDREAIQAELKLSEARLSELFEQVQLHELDGQTSSRTKRASRKERNGRSTFSIDIPSLRRYLAPDQLLLAYFLARGKLVIFALTKDSFASYELADGMERLETLLPLLHARLSPNGQSGSQQVQLRIVRSLLQKLYALLIEPATSLLPSAAGHITIVPFGPLHSLPFHALYNGSNFLIEDFQISYLPAVNMIIQLQTRSDGDAKSLSEQCTVNRHALIFGYSGKQYLPRALEEAKFLADMLKGACYLEEEATIARLNEQAAASSIIHLATHGESRLDAPNFSSVLLADGRLNAIDAFHLDLRGCELVTLSGCETGLSLSGGGDEQLGLGRAFLAAGASSLVMSLWPVEDHATSELMQLFYRHLLNGNSRIQALRAAQCDLLHRDTLHASPYFWAAFRLIGDVGPLHHTSQPLKI
ncbi:MAG: CHAT domain-containing protein, partial [Ktedonobacteraceae bacterium]|nr:CHAT domain-containing protein [Ktedonobacteraceae bacterium]